MSSMKIGPDNREEMNNLIDSLIGKMPTSYCNSEEPNRKPDSAISDPSNSLMKLTINFNS